jgi:hypothetical protein
VKKIWVKIEKIEILQVTQTHIEYSLHRIWLYVIGGGKRIYVIGGNVAIDRALVEQCNAFHINLK